MRPVSRALALASVLLVVVAPACGDGAPGGGGGGGAGGGTGGGAGGAGGGGGGSGEADPFAVDVLFVVDDSPMMVNELLAVAREIPGLVEALTSGDLEGDDVPDFPAASSVRVGVVGADMGVLGVGVIPTVVNPEATSTALLRCGSNGTSVDEDEAFFGEDGTIRLAGMPGAMVEGGCLSQYPSFLTYELGDGGQTSGAFAEEVQCTLLGAPDTCAFTMPLEAFLVATTDSAAHPEIVFEPGTDDGASRDRVGRASPGGTSAGFFRPGSVAVVIVVSDGEDCSTDNPEMFMLTPDETELIDPSHDTAPDLRAMTRCTYFDEELFPVQRYVEGLQNLRPADPDRVVFGAIVGLPPDLEGEDYDAVLADPRMSYTDRLDGDELLDATADPYIEPACWRCVAGDPASYEECLDPIPETGFHEGLKWAAPGRRFVALADQAANVGVRTAVRTLCTDDFAPAFHEFNDLIGQALADGT